MKSSASRKRTLDVTDAGDEDNGLHQKYDVNDHQKRNKSIDDVHDISLVPKAEAWHFNAAELWKYRGIMAEVTPGQLEAYNLKNYDPTKSLFLLCVIGEIKLQLDLLWYDDPPVMPASRSQAHLASSSIYPTLLKLSPNLQNFVLTHDSQALKPLLSASPLVFSAVEPRSKHFLELGVLHPLGGGRQPLDALILIDAVGLRRLVLPFGWGAGKYVADPVTGAAVLDRFTALLGSSVAELERETRRTREEGG